MKTVFVDANIFLRFFTQDDRSQHEKAKNLFKQAESGHIRLLSGPPVLFEIAWVLRSGYKLSHEKTLDTLKAIVAVKGLSLWDAELVERALEIASESGVDFADCYLTASAMKYKADAMATFNISDFKHLPVPLFSFTH